MADARISGVHARWGNFTVAQPDDTFPSRLSSAPAVLQKRQDRIRGKTPPKTILTRTRTTPQRPPWLTGKTFDPMAAALFRYGMQLQRRLLAQNHILWKQQPKLGRYTVHNNVHTTQYKAYTKALPLRTLQCLPAWQAPTQLQSHTALTPAVTVEPEAPLSFEVAARLAEPIQVQAVPLKPAFVGKTVSLSQALWTLDDQQLDEILADFARSGNDLGRIEHLITLAKKPNLDKSEETCYNPETKSFVTASVIRYTYSPTRVQAVRGALIKPIHEAQFAQFHTALARVPLAPSEREIVSKHVAAYLRGDVDASGPKIEALLDRVQTLTGIACREMPYTDSFSNLGTSGRQCYRSLVRLLPQEQEHAPNATMTQTQVPTPTLQRALPLAQALQRAIATSKNGLSARHIEVLKEYAKPEQCAAQSALRHRVLSDFSLSSPAAEKNLQQVIKDQLVALNALLKEPPKTLSARDLRLLKEEALVQFFTSAKLSCSPKKSHHFKREGFSQYSVGRGILGGDGDAEHSELQPHDQEIVTHLQPLSTRSYNKQEVQNYWSFSEYGRKSARRNPPLPLPAHRRYYHTSQEGLPLCQTCCINNYLGDGVLTPELTDRLSLQNQFSAITEIPIIHQLNKQAVLTSCAALLKKHASELGVEEALIEPTLALLNIAQHTFNPEAQPKEQSIASVKALAQALQDSKVERFMMDFSCTSNGHAITLRREAGDDHWVILDSNYAPFSYSLSELLETFVENDRKFTIYAPTQALQDTFEVTKEKLPFYMPLSQKMHDFAQKLPELCAHEHATLYSPLINALKEASPQEAALFQEARQKLRWSDEMEAQYQELPNTRKEFWGRYKKARCTLDAQLEKLAQEGARLASIPCSVELDFHAWEVAMKHLRQAISSHSAEEIKKSVTLEVLPWLKQLELLLNVQKFETALAALPEEALTEDEKSRLKQFVSSHVEAIKMNRQTPSTEAQWTAHWDPKTLYGIQGLLSRMQKLTGVMFYFDETYTVFHAVDPEAAAIVQFALKSPSA